MTESIFNNQIGWLWESQSLLLQNLSYEEDFTWTCGRNTYIIIWIVSNEDLFWYDWYDSCGSQIFEVSQPLSKLSRRRLQVLEVVDMFLIKIYLRKLGFMTGGARHASNLCNKWRVSSLSFNCTHER